VFGRAIISEEETTFAGLAELCTIRGAAATVLVRPTERTAGDIVDEIPVPVDEMTRAGAGRKPPCVVAAGKLDPVLIVVDDGVATVRGAAAETAVGDRAPSVLEAYAGLAAAEPKEFRGVVVADPNELGAPCNTRACVDGYPARDMFNRVAAMCKGQEHYETRAPQL